MGNPITFSPSDLLDQDAPAPKAVANPAASAIPLSSHVTFSPSDIDQTVQPATSYAPPAAVAPPPSMWSRAVAAVKGDPNVQAIGGAIDSATGHTQGIGPVKTLFNALPVSGFLSDLADVPSEYRAYEAARATGASVTDAANIAAQTFKQKNDAIAQAKNKFKEFTDNPGRATGQAVADLIPAIIGGVGLDTAPEAGGDLAGQAAAVSQPGVFKTLVTNPKALVSDTAARASVQPATQAVVRGAASDVADTAGVADSTSLSTAKTVEDVADNVFAKSKGLYKQIDDATGGQFAGNQQLIQNVDKELRMASSDEEVTDLQAKRSEYVAQQNQLFEDAAAKGVPQEVVDQAKASYKQSRDSTNSTIKSR